MRSRAVLLVVLALALAAFDGGAHFMPVDTVWVPISRLFDNLKERLVLNPKDIQATYAMARLSSMAYFTNVLKFKVEKKDGLPFFGYGQDLPPNALYDRDGAVSNAPRPPPNPQQRRETLQLLTNAITYYERTLEMLRSTTNENDEWLLSPTCLGHAWCLDQAGRRSEALTAYRQTLNLAWRFEVNNKFVFRDWVGEAAVKPPLAAGAGAGGLYYYSSEVIQYLLKLLDPSKDAKEIADLKERQKIVESLGRWITPILVPLESGLPFSSLVDSNASVAFDLDGSGLPRRWGWITPKAAWLVYDGAGSGQITSGLQLFGNVTFWIFWRDGYNALSALDANGDGVLRGDELWGLALWQDANGNGVCEPGEVRPLKDFGITAISCERKVIEPGCVWNPKGIQFSNTVWRATYDWTAPCNSAEGSAVLARPIEQR